MATPRTETDRGRFTTDRGATTPSRTPNPYGKAYRPSGSTSDRHGTPNYTGGGSAWWDGTGSSPGDREINRRFLGSESAKDRDLSRYGIDSQERTRRPKHLSLIHI